jgi:predicted nucleic acid-binding protein
MILVDSSVWIDHFRGRASAQAVALDLLLADSAAPIAVADLAVYEVLRGFRYEDEFDDASAFFSALTVVNVGGRERAVAAVRRYRTLQARGYTIPRVSDLLQASFCIDNDCHLLHADTDFDAAEKWLGLKVWRQMTIN